MLAPLWELQKDAFQFGKEYASLLYDEAMLLEGREPQDKQEFIKKINNLFTKAFK